MTNLKEKKKPKHDI